MSTDYRFSEKFSKSKLLEAVGQCGLKVHKEEKSDKICVTDGINYIWFYADLQDVGYVIYSASRYGSNYNGENTIIRRIADYLDINVISEHDPGYFEDMEDE